MYTAVGSVFEGEHVFCSVVVLLSKLTESPSPGAFLFPFTISMTQKLIIFDFNRTLYDPEAQCLIEGALPLLNAVQARQCCIALVSKREKQREDLVHALGIAEYFSHIHFVPTKTPEIMQQVVAHTGAAPHDTYLVGDHLHSDIRAGNEAGIKTIHVKQGAFATLTPRDHRDIPWRTVASLSDVTQYIT